MKDYLKIFMAEDGGGGGGSAKPEGDPAAKPDDKTGGDEKKYSDKELNDILKGKSAEGVTKLLKELGCDSPKLAASS